MFIRCIFSALNTNISVHRISKYQTLKIQITFYQTRIYLNVADQTDFNEQLEIKK